MAELEKAAYTASKIESLSAQGIANHYFKLGAKWTEENSGKMFTKEDLREAFEQGVDHSELPWKYYDFETWYQKKYEK